MTHLEVVQRAAAGDPDAIRTILEACQGPALAIGLSFTDDRDGADDLAQEILVTVCQSLSSLKEPERFWGWFETLAHRVCMGWMRKEDRRRLSLGGLCIQDEREDPSVALDPFSGPEEALLEAERRRAIQKSLRRVSLQSRKALELFYLDGLSLKEIARQLNVSENTVKQRLHWGRSELRKELITMPETADERQRPPENQLLKFYYWGQCSSGDTPYNPSVLTRSLMAQQILLQIAKKPRTEHELTENVGADRIYIADHLSQLVKGELVQQVDGDRYAPGFFILDQNAQTSLAMRMQDIGRKDADIIAGHIPAAREAFDRCPFEAQRFGWDDMRWILVAVFLAHLGIRRAHPEVYAIRPPLRPDGNAWFFFGLTRDVSPPRWVGGCNSSYDEFGGVGHFWTPAIRKPGVSMPGPKARQMICALSVGPKTLEAVQRETGLEEAQTIAAEMIEAGYIVQEGDRLRLTIPVFTEAKDHILCPVVERMCQEVVEKSRKPGLKGLDGVLDDLGFRRLKHQYPAMHASLSSDISGYCIGALVEMGHLGTPPAEVPATWACWAWKGAIKLMK